VLRASVGGDVIELTGGTFRGEGNRSILEAITV